MVGAPDAMTAYAAIKDGTVRQIAITHKAGKVEHRMGASWKLKTQIEGCVIDPATGALFVGEEDVGIWKIDPARPEAAPVLFAAADGRQLVVDVEGLAIATNANGASYLLASSQGDRAYAVFDTATGKLLGRFRIDGGAIDGTFETDGIEMAVGDFGPGFEQGVFIAQDGDNGGGTQNFKLVSWAAIKAALGL
jgi:3-phytase